MPLEKIYVVRHGFRSNWLVDPATGTYSAYVPSPTGIPADPALTSHGVSQARELGRHLMTLDPPVEAVYSSPFYRCLQTLEPFTRHLELQKQHQDGSAPVVVASIRLEHGIREWFGSAPFSHPQPAAATVLKSMFPVIDDSYEPVVVPSSYGETLAQLQERVVLALRGIIGQCDAQGTRSALLCTHAAVVIMLGRILTGQVPESVDTEDFDAYTCGLSVFRRKGSGHGEGSGGQASMSAHSSDATATFIGGWHCERNSDCSFLSGGQERGWYVPTFIPCRCSSSRDTFPMCSSSTALGPPMASSLLPKSRGSQANPIIRSFAGDESFPGTVSVSPADAESKL